MGMFVGRLVLVVLVCAGVFAPAIGQTAPGEPGKTSLHLSAVLGQASAPLQAGLHWRIFNERAEPDGSHALVAESSAALPAVAVTPGDYVVHVAFGLASATKRINVGDEERSERLTLNAGALRIVGTRGDAPIDANRLSLAIYVPERNNPEAKLVYSKSQGRRSHWPAGRRLSYRVDLSRSSASARARKSGRRRPTPW